MNTRRSTDNADYMRSLETELAKAERDLRIVTLNNATLSIENANLKHQMFAKDQELAKLRRVRCDALVAGIERGLHQEEPDV